MTLTAPACASGSQTPWQDKLDRLLAAPCKSDVVLGGETLMEQLLCRIDDTVLPRQMCLRAEGQILARLLVSHRKLLQLEITGQTVATGEPADAAVHFTRALQRLSILVAGPLSLDSCPCSMPELSPRCSAAQLRAALEQPNGSEQDELWSKALASLRPSASSATPVYEGDPAYFDVLDKALTALHRTAPISGAARLPGQGDRQQIMLLPLATDKTLVLCSGQDAATVWAAVYATASLPTVDRFGTSQLGEIS